MVRMFAGTVLAMLMPTLAHACSGTALSNSSLTKDDVKTTMTKGQVIGGLDHILRDPTTGTILACAGSTCYPAIGEDDEGAMSEALDLKGCKIADAATKEGRLERHEIEADAPQPVQDEDDAIERKKMHAASVVALDLAGIFGSVSVAIDSATHSHAVHNDNTLGYTAEIIRLKPCVYQITQTMSDKTLMGSRWTIDFNQLTGATRTYRTRWGEKINFLGNNTGKAASCRALEHGQACWQGMTISSGNIEQAVHDTQYMLQNGCGESVRGPDPY